MLRRARAGTHVNCNRPTSVSRETTLNFVSRPCYIAADGGPAVRHSCPFFPPFCHARPGKPVSPPALRRVQSGQPVLLAYWIAQRQAGPGDLGLDLSRTLSRNLS